MRFTILNLSCVYDLCNLDHDAVEMANECVVGTVRLTADSGRRSSIDVRRRGVIRGTDDVEDGSRGWPKK